jgi:Domain of unknown function DUF29
MTPMRNPSSDLYERDYYAWLHDQVRALRERRIEDVDWENVAEEIEGLSKSEKHGVRSQMARLVEHLLKLSYARSLSREYNARGWRLSVRSARFEINKLLQESPSLGPRLPEMLPDAYYAGRLGALRYPEMSEEELPELCPWTVEQVMDESFLPGEAATTPD